MTIQAHGITSEKSQDLINWAYKFAIIAHGEQKRKYTGEPYVNHPVEVARLVASVTDDVNMICAAFLHDVIEDTWVNYDNLLDLRLGFGKSIADLVLEVTEEPKREGLTRKERKSFEAMRLAFVSPNAQTIKLADIISNTQSIAQHDPKFAKVYMVEKKELLKVLTKGDSELYNQAKKIVEDYYASTN